MRFSTTLTYDTGVDGCLINQPGERRLAEVIRTAAGDERPSRIEQLERAEVDLLVAGRGLGDRRLVLRERGRIEDDRVKALAQPLEATQFVEDVAHPRVDDHAVPVGVGAEVRDRLFGGVDRDRFLAMPPERDGEPAVITEAIEQAPACIPGGRRPVLALIEKQPRLLPGSQINGVGDADLGDTDLLGNVACQYFDALLEAFEETRTGSLRARMPSGWSSSAKVDTTIGVSRSMPWDKVCTTR